VCTAVLYPPPCLNFLVLFLSREKVQERKMYKAKEQRSRASSQKVKYLEEIEFSSREKVQEKISSKPLHAASSCKFPLTSSCSCFRFRMIITLLKDLKETDKRIEERQQKHFFR